jgi:ABC-2 type transport system permease protein
MFVGFGAITKERETGSLKLLLSLPHSRQDVVVGKVVGRMVVVGVPLVIAFFLTAVFLVLSSLNFKPDLYALFSLYTLGLALVFVAIAVSISGAVSKGLYSIVGNFIVYVYFTFGWNTLANSVADWLGQYLGMSGAPRWHITLIIKLLNPSQAYKTLTNSMLGQAENTALAARFGMFSQGPEKMRVICSDVLAGTPKEVEGFFGPQITCQAGGGSLPFYYSDAAVFVYLLLWIGVAALISYKTFNLADL